jgi:excisionase family DNA binding protein
MSELKRSRNKGKDLEPLALTVDETSEVLRLSRSKLYGMWKEGKGPRFVHVGNKRLITRAAIDAFLQSLETPAPSATA